jgi:hypothetical protein
MNWMELLKAIAAIGAAAAALIPILNSQLFSRPRAKLKTDLEILHLLDPHDENYPLVKASVDSSIRTIYLQQEKRKLSEKLKRFNWRLLITGVIVLGGFGWWTVSLVRDDSWWAIVTGYFTFIGLGYIASAFRTPHLLKTRQQ